LSDCTIWHSNVGNAFELPPTSGAVGFGKPTSLAEPAAYRDRSDVGDIADDFERHLALVSDGTSKGVASSNGGTIASGYEAVGRHRTELGHGFRVDATAASHAAPVSVRL
jgi:hypothetical protein